MSVQFNPLNGTELMEVIIADIRRAMIESGEFSQNLTYQWIKYDYKIKMVSYPKNSAEDEPQEVVTGGAAFPDPDFPPLDIDAVDTQRLFLEPDAPVIVDTPDQARVDADLPLPTPVPVVNVGIVDKPIRQAKKGK